MPFSERTVLYVLLPGRGDNKRWTRQELFFFLLYDASPSLAVFNRRQSVCVKAVSDAWER